MNIDGGYLGKLIYGRQFHVQSQSWTVYYNLTPNYYNNHKVKICEPCVCCAEACVEVIEERVGGLQIVFIINRKFMWIIVVFVKKVVVNNVIVSTVER